MQPCSREPISSGGDMLDALFKGAGGGGGGFCERCRHSVKIQRDDDIRSPNKLIREDGVVAFAHELAKTTLAAHTSPCESNGKKGCACDRSRKSLVARVDELCGDAGLLKPMDAMYLLDQAMAKSSSVAATTVHQIRPWSSPPLWLQQPLAGSG
uniref:Uncharacterized protein n=1 Tax=Oryza sativa subsp. japonica TaxID=39947 RepID=Q6Z4T4_ORYSJ|nr:hypothetical protein [Oryza sativa Japonica Group]BAD05555.1 hypothetical protein [Oryza sativa Japonica Group]